MLPERWVNLNYIPGLILAGSLIAVVGGLVGGDAGFLIMMPGAVCFILSFEIVYALAQRLRK